MSREDKFHSAIVVLGVSVIVTGLIVATLLYQPRFQRCKSQQIAPTVVETRCVEARTPEETLRW